MDANEQQVIDGLFDRIRKAEGGSGERDAAAERRIGEHLGKQPAAPYYMAQAILVQEQALHSAQQKIEQLEQQATQRQSGGGGFLSGLFGGGAGSGTGAGGSGPWSQNRGHRGAPTPQMQEMSRYQRQGGGGFLAGAMQTAMGVAGGLVVGNLLMDAFSGGGEELAAGAEGMVNDAVEPVADMAPAEDFGGDMGGFDEEI